MKLAILSCLVAAASAAAISLPAVTVAPGLLPFGIDATKFNMCSGSDATLKVNSITAAEAAATRQDRIASFIRIIVK